ncbi:MAG: hypothetical protein N3G22_04530 [Candidatus Micrarchaeota archaeon]|nr:hypothetical protein [Candidatus Micrarchaeota archaeon]
MEESEKQALIARAAKLESRQLFVKAAEIYIKAGAELEAASAYEKAMAYDKAELLYRKLGKNEEAERCRQKREQARSEASKSWLDLQAEFQKDKGNPY